MEINFEVTQEEFKLIEQIAERAVVMAPTNTKLDVIMDITACHANGCPLKLKALLEADNFNFAHDVFGIYRHLDRSTGKLTDCFSPRFSA